MLKGFGKWASIVGLGFVVSAAVMAQGGSALQPGADVGGGWKSQGLEKAERLALATEIMAERERRAGRPFDKAWAEGWVEKLAARDLASLKSLLAATRAGEPAPLKHLGSTTHDLVFTPLATSCLVLDTRFDAFPGNVPGDVTYPFAVAGALDTVFDQGGVANCGVPFGPAVAVVANVIAVDPEGKGNMQVWNWATTMKGNSVINFGGPINNENLINGIMVPICNPAINTCDFDLNVEVNFTDSDIVFNVTGFFAPPDATALECTTVSETQSHSATFDFESPTCPSGFALTGGGHNWFPTGLTDVWFWQVSPNGSGNAYRCRGNVDLGPMTSTDITCYARCCRVPGI